MSLLQSIFGSKKATSAPAISSDLFETTITVPEPKPYITHSTKKKRKAPPAAAAAVETNKDESVNETTEGVDISAKEQNEAVNDKTTDDAADDDEERTIFVGNLPVSITRKSLAALFSNCDSKVVSTRIRSVATTGVKLPATSAGNQKLVKKVCTHVPGKIDATIKDNLHAYVVFADASSVAIAIGKHNNSLLNGHYIRVDTASPTIDPKRCVFVGNLPYASQEESLRQHFVTTMNNCRPDDILGVRVVRDKETFQCRGFAYVLFAEASLVAAALQQVHGTIYLKKELRVLVCGKRFKNKQGQYDRSEPGRNKKLPKLTPQQELATSTGAWKRILTKQVVESDSNNKKKNKRVRGETKKGKNSTPVKAGVSKRKASATKLGQREKKIKKRMDKGMGKTKKA